MLSFLSGISLFQCPTVSNMGIAHEKLTLNPMEMTEKYELPDDFTIVPAIAFKKEKVSIPEPPNVTTTINGNLNEAITQEKCWLKHAMMLMEKEEIEVKDVIAWSAYHASQENISDNVQPLLTQFLPLFYEKAAMAAMSSMAWICSRRPHNF